MKNQLSSILGGRKSAPRSKLYFTAATPRLVLGTTEDARKQSKLVSLVRPERLPLPYAYCCVEVFVDASGVDVCDPDTGRHLLHLDCDFDTFEEEWAGLLPVFSEAYLEGDSDARDYNSEGEQS